MRRTARSLGAGSGWEARKLISLILMLCVIGLIWQSARNPRTWRWLAPEPDQNQGVVPPEHKQLPLAAGKKPAWKETIVPATNDREPAEFDAAKKQLLAVTDHSNLGKFDMSGYWHLVKWSRSESFKDLEKRARRDVLFTQLFEVPDKYRGKLIRLRLHIRRVLKLEQLDENPQGVKDMYELWGWTEDSKSYPYVVVVSELPPGFTLGDDVRHEAVFAGYFLKWMSYQATEKRRSAPLLIGRVSHLSDEGRPQSKAAQPRPQGTDWTLVAVAAGGIALAGLAIWFVRRESQRARAAIAAAKAPVDEAPVEQWLVAPPPEDETPAHSSADRPA